MGKRAGICSNFLSTIGRYFLIATQFYLFFRLRQLMRVIIPQQHEASYFTYQVGLFISTSNRQRCEHDEHSVAVSKGILVGFADDN